MLLTKEEFIAIKPELVQDVLKHLRKLARLEGELLLRAYNNYPGDLPHFSERISLAIAKVTDAITDFLQDYEPEDEIFKELFPLIEENLPKKLADYAGDRIKTKFPVQYQRNAIASTLASNLVYKEGIHLVESQPPEKIAQRALLYFRAERDIAKLLGEVDKISFSQDDQAIKEKVKNILSKGGARTALNIF